MFTLVLFFISDAPFLFSNILWSFPLPSEKQHFSLPCFIVEQHLVRILPIFIVRTMDLCNKLNPGLKTHWQWLYYCILLWKNVIANSMALWAKTTADEIYISLAQCAPLWGRSASGHRNAFAPGSREMYDRTLGARLLTNEEKCDTIFYCSTM